MSQPPKNNPKPAKDRDACPPSGPARPGRCPMCGHPLELLWVHGHGQCAVCGMNIDECCQGAPLPTDDSATRDRADDQADASEAPNWPSG